jgi:predicted small lipoprotein YifL
MKKWIAILVIGMLIFGLAGCGKQSPVSDAASATSAADSGLASSADSSTSSSALATSVTVSDDDRDSSWDEATATKIVLGSTISVNGSGADVKGNVVTVTTAGTYVVSGILSDGQIVVDATTKDEVQLVLNGAQITNKSGAAIYASQCDNLKITLADGTKNALTDGGSTFVYTDTANEEPNAAVFSKDSLTINGTGALTVDAGFNNGIGTKDNLVIVSGSLIVNAAGNGIRGNDSVAVLDGNITITAGNDGIQTSNAEKSGTIDIRGGTFKIVAAHDGIQSENGLLIAGGIFDMKSGGGTAVAAGTSDSYKGLKAVGDMDISAGTFVIDGTDDTVHANGNITIRGGDFTLSSGDDGIHADNTLTVNGGSINVKNSYEGLEGSIVNISDGTIVVHSTDDGINSAGGTNAGVGGGSYGNDQFASDGSADITIKGGVITLYTTSDGIDANGALTVAGGTIAVLIGTTHDGDATDVDNGGTIQPALYGTGNINAGTKIEVGDLWSLTVESNVTSYCLMIPGVADGQSYKITANGADLATVTATTAIQGMMGGGNAGGMGGHRGGPAGGPGGGSGGNQI